MMPLKILKGLASLGVLFLAMLFYDGIQFAKACTELHHQALSRTGQLNQDPDRPYTFVVLTGDRVRIPEALSLLKAFPRSQLLISGLSKKTSLTEIADLSPEEYRSDTELWKRVVVESESTSTIQNAQETQKYLRAHEIHEIVLVTSDYHLTRALAIFDKWVSAEVIPYAVSSDWPARALLEYWKWVAYRFNVF